MAGLVLFLILFGIPAIEIGLFIVVGGEIGVWSTLGVVVLTAFVGTILVRAQGLSVLRELNANMEKGGLPIGALISGACLVVAGILLVTPGFMTDAIGFALLIPPVRTVLGAGLVSTLAKHGTFRSFSARTGPIGGRGPTIDGEFVDLSKTADTETNTNEDVPPELIDPPHRPVKKET